MASFHRSDCSPFNASELCLAHQFLSQLQSWTKMLRKMHVVCLILEYFPLKRGSLKILPPSPQKTMLKCGSNIFAAY